ncbi:hypothetical protein NF212_23710 [Parasalinivibrio latis]|uniref:hypothetical protein n=1 Tax=Parasalinivibrio latis TaxID=2952610 RepID=UPI0030E32864
MSDQAIAIDLLYVIDKLLPGKRITDMYRTQHKHIALTTLPLKHCDSVSSLQFALYQYSANYVAATQGKPLAEQHPFRGSADEIAQAKSIMTPFIRGAYWWVEHHIAQQQEHFTTSEKARWTTDFKLLVQAIIGISNCTNSQWLLKYQGPIQALTYDAHFEPFLNHYG